MVGQFISGALASIRESVGLSQARKPAVPLFPQTTEERSGEKGRALFTQQTVLAMKGDTQGGLCAPLTNLYARHRMGHASDDFLGDPDVAYTKAVAEERHQGDLVKQGKDGLHSAFVDAEVAYETKEIPMKEIASIRGLEQLLSKPAHVLLTYPKGTDGKKHMIYLGRSPTLFTRCYQYDSNRYTSALFGPCSKIIAFTAKQLLEEGTEVDGQTTTVALSPA